MHDAFQCSEIGIPSTVVVTTPFENLARLTAGRLGVPNFPVMLPKHPAFTRGQAWIAARTDELVEPLSHMLIER